MFGDRKMRQLVGNLRSAEAHDHSRANLDESIHKHRLCGVWPKTPCFSVNTSRHAATSSTSSLFTFSLSRPKTNEMFEDFIRNSLWVAKLRNCSRLLCQHFPFTGNTPTTANTQLNNGEENLMKKRQTRNESESKRTEIRWFFCARLSSDDEHDETRVGSIAWTLYPWDEK